MRNRPLLVYIDNDAARYGLIKGSSPTRDSAWLIDEYWRLETEQDSYTWIERVPSASNCADGPSRGAWAELWHMAPAFVRKELPRQWSRRLCNQWAARHGEWLPRPESPGRLGW